MEIKDTKMISIVIPCYNEADGLEQLADRLKQLMNRLADYSFEVVLVENGSMDNSFEIMEKIHLEDNRFKIIQLSRNFMADGGVAAGLQFVSGDCAVIMDADLQDPPEVIDDFVVKWEEGFDVVFGIIIERAGVSPVRKLINKIFYFMVNVISKGVIPKNVTAFRLMDRKVYSQLNLMKERNRFTRGLCSWTGFKQIGIPFYRADRYAGDSNASFSEIFKEALDAMFAFSFIPLRVISLIGVILSLSCFVFLIYEVVYSLLKGSELPGIPTIISIMMLMFGFMFIFLGIMGEYLARVFDEVKERPIYIVNRKLM